MNCQHYWKDPWLVTPAGRPGPGRTAHCSLVDQRAGGPPTAGPQLQAWQAPRDPPNAVLSHTLRGGRAVRVGPGCCWLPRCEVNRFVECSLLLKV